MELPEPLAFQWDRGNIDKNLKLHVVASEEIEEVFADENKKIFTNKLHSGKEERFRVVGKTRSGRLLFAVFTIRKDLIRPISARDVNRKEVSLYEKAT